MPEVAFEFSTHFDFPSCFSTESNIANFVKFMKSQVCYSEQNKGAHSDQYLTKMKYLFIDLICALKKRKNKYIQ